MKLRHKRIILLGLFFLSLATGTIGEAGEGIEVEFFFSPGCRECEEVKVLLRETEKELGIPLDVTYTDITVENNIERLWAWEDKTGKKAEDLISVVIGETFLAGQPEIKAMLKETIMARFGGGTGKSARTVAPPASRRTIESEFAEFGIWAVLGAGLIDGVNPCAFTVLVLLISFLTITGVSRSNILWIGFAFAFSVFLTYFLVGLGLFSALLKSVHYRSLADYLYLVIGGISFILGVISVYDAAVVYRTRELKDARLKLPPMIMSRIQRVITGKFNPRHIFVSALVLGFLVSLLELVCTGQIYLPTIILIMQNPALRDQAIAYLILYCFAFITPLLVVFGLVYWGSEVAKISDLTSRYSWVLKLLTGLIFIALGIFLFANY